MPAPNPADFGAVALGAPHPEDFGAVAANDAAPAPTGARPAGSAWDDLVAGYQGSATGLLARGKLPDVVLDSTHAKWYDKALEGIGSTASDLPEMVAGGWAGAKAGPKTGWALANAVPAEIRTALVKAYQTGEADSSSTFLQRAGIVIKGLGDADVQKATAKAAAVGALTAGAGQVASKVAGPLLGDAVAGGLSPTLARAGYDVAKVGAEAGTMAVAPAALEGRLPEPQDFANAAIVVGGLKLASGIAGKMANIYSRTGIEPEQVVADAKAEPTIALDLKPIEAPAAVSDEPMIDAYHGSQHIFEAFDSGKIGTGEGAQAYGHGLYFAENPSTADSYRTLPGSKPTLTIGDQTFPYESEAAQAFLDGASHGKTVAQARVDLAAKAEQFKYSGTGQAFDKARALLDGMPDDARIGAGNLYRVQIPQRVVDGMLDWDKPLSEQAPTVRDAVRPILRENMLRNGTPERMVDQLIDKKYGEDAYKDLIPNRGKAGASQVLRAAGVTGIRYLDAGSRQAGEGTRNFVLFDAKDARVIERNGQTVDTPAAERTDEVPRAYVAQVAATTAREVIPDPKTDPNHALDLAAMISNPYGTIPAEKLPNFENFSYVDGPEKMQAASARTSEIFEGQIQAARGTQTWEQTKQGAIEFLAKRAADLGESFTMPATDDAVVKLASKGMAAESMQQAASRALAAAADKINREGATPENVNAQIGAIEMVRAWTALDQGNGAEIARALNARKAALQMRLLSEDLFEGMNRYGDDPEAMAKFITSLGDPQKVGKFARMVQPATTMEKLLQYYRFSLLSGATVFQVKAIGDMSATVERVLNAAIRAPIGALHGEGMARTAELTGMLSQFGQGVKDGMSAMVDTWKALQTPRAVFGKPGSPNLADKITSLPGRIIESETELFLVLNERMEMGRQAAIQARQDGFKPGAGDYSQRIAALLQSPTKDMQDASMAAGRDATFTNKTSGVGAGLQALSQGKIYGPGGKAFDAPWGGFLVPFARVPVNIAAWTIKDTPGIGLLMKGNREAWAEGGSARDGVMARQIIGGTAALLAAGAVSGGRMTGGGLSMTPEEHAGRRASIPDYSFKIGSTWYSYERFQPLGAVAGLAADLMEMHQKADTQYQPDIAKLTGAVMGHAIISQPYFEAMNDLMKALTSPEGEGAKQFDRFTASWIPSFLAQAASASDPYKRQVNDLFDAVQARIPVWRAQLTPQINPLTGQPVANTAFPVRGAGLVGTMDASNDPVLQEAARLRVGAPRAPKSIELPTGIDRDRTLGKEDLSPEQQEIFSSTFGQFVHATMTPLVNSDRWEGMPDMVKKTIFTNVMKTAHALGDQAALPAAQRAAKMQEIAEEITAKLRQLKDIK